VAKPLEFAGSVWAGAVVLSCLPAGGTRLAGRGQRAAALRAAAVVKESGAAFIGESQENYSLFYG